jgi:protease-4
MENTQDPNSWEHKTINNMLEMSIKEQRAKRRWGIFFKLCVLGYIVLLTIYMISQKHDITVDLQQKPFTAVVNIEGEIAADDETSAEKIIPALKSAFEHQHAAAVMLRINSPGGSPVQVQQIYTELQYLKKKHPKKKVYAVIEEAGASGAYWLACGADEIYADKMSLVGSIGVILSSFGFVDAMNKLGVERRAYYAGENKDMLDPFAPRNPVQDAMIMENIQIAHQLFVDLVKESRGDRLKETPDMFSGRFWLGAQCKDLGLIDGFGDPYTVARDVIKAENLVEFNESQDIFAQFAKKFGHTMRHAAAEWHWR